MERRTFLRRLAGMIAAATVIDPEELIWVPKTMVSVPSCYQGGISLYAMDEIVLRQICAPLIASFAKADPLLAYLRRRGPLHIPSGPPLQAPFFYVGG